MLLPMEANDLLQDLLHRLRQIPDPLERARHAQRLIADGPDALARVRFDAMVDLGKNGMNHSEIGAALGLTRARVSQILKAGPPSERALLAPEPGAPLKICVVQKRETEQGRPAIAQSTMTAIGKLHRLASDLGIEVSGDDGYEAIPPPGIIDLNENNLVVLMGPRTSALIAQAITSDPAIQWQRDKRNNWYIRDVNTGQEFHSEFDGTSPPGEGDRTCVAHIGRIRRPDGRGGFLYLAGAHAPGTAGAVEYFISETSSLWGRVKHSLWSAVVQATVNDEGKVTAVELATPIYVHGKR